MSTSLHRSLIQILDKRDEKFLKNLGKINIAEVVSAVKLLKVDVERLRMENKWMQNYLRENIDEKRITFGSRLLSVATIKFQSFSSSAPAALNHSMKTELCEQEVFKIEREIREKQKKSYQEMKKVVAELQDSEITCKEFTNIIDELKKKFSDERADPKANKSSTQNFVDDLIRNCAAIATLIRMKTEATKSDCRKLKRMVMKREELSSCLQPVDFELVTLEKEKFKKMEVTKTNYLMGLNNEVVSVSSFKNEEQKKFLKAKLKFDEITRKIEISEKSSEAMKLEVETLKTDIDNMEKSIAKLSDLSDVYEAPSVKNYVEKIAERDTLKKNLKTLQRKNDLAKNSLKTAKQKLRDCEKN